MCSLVELAACFTLGGLYFDTGVEFLKDRDRNFTESFYGERLHVMNAGTGEEYIEQRVVRELADPDRESDTLYNVSIGYEIDFKQWRIDAQAFHREGSGRDDGDTGASLRVRFFPFR